MLKILLSGKFSFFVTLQWDSSRHRKSTRAVSMQARYYNDSLMIHTWQIVNVTEFELGNRNYRQDMKWNTEAQECQVRDGMGKVS